MLDPALSEIRELFLQRGRVCRFSAGEQIWIKDSHASVLYYLKSGRMRAYYIYPDGEDRTLCFVGPDNLVGEEVMAHPPKRIDYVDAVTDSVMYSLGHDELMEYLHENQSAMEGILALCMKKIELLCSWIFYSQFRKNPEKVASFLYYSTENDGDTLSYTQQQIADVTGMTRPSVSSCLRSFADEGFIRFQYKHIQVQDRNRLKSLFGSLEFTRE